MQQQKALNHNLCLAYRMYNTQEKKQRKKTSHSPGTRISEPIFSKTRGARATRTNRGFGNYVVETFG